MSIPRVSWCAWLPACFMMASPVCRAACMRARRLGQAGSLRVRARDAPTAAGAPPCIPCRLSGAQAAVTTVVTGAPRVFNPAAAAWYDALMGATTTTRIVNNMDVVPSLPPEMSFPCAAPASPSSLALPSSPAVCAGAGRLQLPEKWTQANAVPQCGPSDADGHHMCLAALQASPMHARAACRTALGSAYRTSRRRGAAKSCGLRARAEHEHGSPAAGWRSAWLPTRAPQSLTPCALKQCLPHQQYCACEPRQPAVRRALRAWPPMSSRPRHASAHSTLHVPPTISWRL